MITQTVFAIVMSSLIGTAVYMAGDPWGRPNQKASIPARINDESSDKTTV